MRFLKNTLLKASLILVVSSWVSKIIGISVAVLLANKFTVENYGLAVGYLILINFTDVFTFGFSSAVINYRGKERVKDKLDLAWTFDNFLPKIFLSILIILLGDKFLYLVTGVKSHAILYFSLIPLLKALETNAITILTRELNFGTRSILELVRSISYFLSSIIFINLSYGPILVVYSMLISQLIRTFWSYFIINKTPRIYFNKVLFLSMLKFSKWISLANIIKLLKNQIDKIILGYITGVRELAIYNNGAKIPIQIGQDFSKNFANLLFPIYSQKDKTFSNNVTKINNLSLVFSIMVILLTYFFGKNLIVLIFGKEYISSVLYLNILIPVIGLKMIYSNVESLLKSKGYSKVDFYCGSFFLFGILLLLIFDNVDVIHFAYVILALEYILVLSVLMFHKYRFKTKILSNWLFLFFNLTSIFILVYS